MISLKVDVCVTSSATVQLGCDFLLQAPSKECSVGFDVVHPTVSGFHRLRRLLGRLLHRRQLRFLYLGEADLCMLLGSLGSISAVRYFLICCNVE
jgi:hypothetical protein